MRLRARPRRRRHPAARAGAAPRRISRDTTHARRRLLGRHQHGALHHRRIHGRLLGRIFRLALAVFVERLGRSARGGESSPRCSTAAAFSKPHDRFDTIGFTLLAACCSACRPSSTWAMISTGSHRRFLAIAAHRRACWRCRCSSFGSWRATPGARLYVCFAIATYAIATVLLGRRLLGDSGPLSVFVVQLQVLLGYTSLARRHGLSIMIFLAMAAAAVVHEITRNVDARLIVFLDFIGLAVTFVWLGQYDKRRLFR